MLRKYQPNGPLVNSEFYPGWFTHWQEPKMATRDTESVAESLRCILYIYRKKNPLHFIKIDKLIFT